MSSVNVKKGKEKKKTKINLWQPSDTSIVPDAFFEVDNSNLDSLLITRYYQKLLERGSPRILT